MKYLIIIPSIIFMSVFFGISENCQSQAKNESYEMTLSLVAESDNQWTGLAINEKDRMFVNFPRWTENTPISVGEIVNGKVTPFPDASWNNWDGSVIVKNKFICVQSIQADENGQLWILDTGYDLHSDSTKGAHLYVFNIKARTLRRDYSFPLPVVSGGSYVNDFRIDAKKKVVYITDSGKGGIILLDLTTGDVKRVLSNHPSTLTERTEISIEGLVRKHPVHSDGIALNSKYNYLYYCALMGQYVYRISTNALLEHRNNDGELGKYVEKFASTGANDGIEFDRKGNLYLSSIEQNAISLLTPEGELQIVVRDQQIKWPDSFSVDKKGNVFFTTAQIHLPRAQRGSYKIFKISAAKK